jgi:hypothetical protein
MTEKEEMQHVARFSRGRAAHYQEIADQGGDHTLSAESAQDEADKFQGYADRITRGIAQRKS